jgi:8-oxo-dGTP diphosphatase
MSNSPTRQPRVGCGAAILRDGELLLVLRRRPPEADHWGLPGGKLDWGETARACAEREVAEELGITITAGPVLCVSDLLGADYHWVSPVFLAHDVIGEPAVREPEALADRGWFALDALPQPLTAAALAAVEALARPG